MENKTPKIILVVSNDLSKWARVVAVARALLAYPFHLIDLSVDQKNSDKLSFNANDLVIFTDETSRKWCSQKIPKNLSTLSVHNSAHFLQAILDWEIIKNKNQIPLNWGFHTIENKNCSWNELKTIFNEPLLARVRILMDALEKAFKPLDIKDSFQSFCKIYCDGSEFYFEIKLPENVRTIISPSNKDIEINGSHLIWLTCHDCVILKARTSVTESLGADSLGYQMKIFESQENALPKNNLSKQGKAG